MATKVVTGKVRFSYVNVFEPQVPQAGGDPKYSVTLLIPKTDTKTVGMIKAAIAEARENFCKKNGANALPLNPVSPLHDGDGVKPNSGEPYGPECKGCWVLSTSAKEHQKPVVVDEFGNEISGPATVCSNPSAVYSGCYGRASINFYGYSNVRKGIGAGLLGIKKLHDGEPFGTFGSASDFDDDYRDPEAGADDDFMG
jgi:hypothetical protein